MKNLRLLFVLATVFSLFTACNPDCESYARISAEITPSVRMPGDQIMVKTSPADFLEERQLFIEKVVDGELIIDETTRLPSEYVDMPTAKGRIATLPMDVEGNRNIYIRDNDCGGFIPLNSVTVASSEFIANNQSLFISPAAPQIVIPSLPTVPPVNVINTWFSPNNRDYCVWIVPELILDSMSGCYREGPNLVPGNTRIGPGNRESGSYELAPGCATSRNAGLFSGNPVSGFIDRNSGFVSLSIDRTSKGLGIEQYEGSLMTPESVPAADRVVGACEPLATGEQAQTMLVANSKTTGRQLVLYLYDVVPEGFHGKTFCQ
ncbi:MAG: hypothetical protein AAF960_24110 [Bacteroidota bacterium]